MVGTSRRILNTLYLISYYEYQSDLIFHLILKLYNIFELIQFNYKNHKALKSLWKIIQLKDLATYTSLNNVE